MPTLTAPSIIATVAGTAPASRTRCSLRSAVSTPCGWGSPWATSEVSSATTPWPRISACSTSGASLSRPEKPRVMGDRDATGRPSADATLGRVSGAAGTEISSGPVPCANHPRVETAVRCSDCGKPICPDCMVQSRGRHQVPGLRSPAALRARDAAARPRRPVGARVVRRGHAVRAAAGRRRTTGLGFFSFIIAFVVGLLVGRAVLWASGRYRSTTVAWIAVGGAVWAYVVPAIVISIDSGLGLRAGVQVLGVLIAGFAAYREVT